MKFNFRICIGLSVLTLCVACDDVKRNAEKGKKSAAQVLTDQQAGTAAKILNDGSKDTAAQQLTKVALLLNWYPEAEHGGFYAAKTDGIFERFGLDVEIKPGGNTTLVPQELTLGRIQFGVANADDVLIARNEDVPLVALMAPIQNGPRCIMVRRDSGIQGFADLKNIKLQINKARPYVPFLKSKGFLTEGVEIVPFYGTVDQLVAGPGVATQGYSFSEPFMAKQKGVEVTELMMSEIGYNPYCSLLVTTESYSAKNNDVCKRMTQASVLGWKAYLQSPSAANAIILSKNKQGLEKEALEYGVEALKTLCYTSESKDDSDIGKMTRQRWDELATTLTSLQMIDQAKVSVEKAYSLDFQ
jgi:NitT/TauT family transport system substrate-binding protein